MISWAAFAQQAGIRVITPDSEHIYSADPAAPQQLLDDEALQLQNERARRAKLERDQREDARRQEELDAERARIRAEQDQAAANAWQDRENAGILTFGSLRRSSTTAAVAGSSSHRRHRDPRVPR